jgi:hypothetical protein
MNKNLDLIAKELFAKLRTQFPEISLKDEKNDPTGKPSKARTFDFDYVYEGENLGRITINISDKDEDDDGDIDGLVVIYSNDITSGEGSYSKKQFFNFLKELREFAKQRTLNFDTRDIAKSNLEKRDYKFLSKSGDGNMTESKLYGTSKTSFQQFGESKIIVKHSAPVNLDNPAGRTQRIESIYIENIEGERFKYPFKHLNGARALAQHICHGGTPYDNIGQHITGLSEEVTKLRMFKSYVDRNPMVSESMSAVNSKVMERIESIKKQIFSLQNANHYEQFAESFEEAAAREIPEEIMNDWIDRLTIKSFNEELKNVFPYIFKLVDESDIPVKELTIEDLVNEEKCETCGMDPCDCDHSEEKQVKEFAEFENFINRVAENADIFSDDQESQMAAIDRLNQLVAEPFPVGTDGNNAIESLADVIDDQELMEVFKELADINPEQDVRDILKDYITIKDQENGTDILSKVNFGAEEEPTEVPAEPAAEPAPAAAEAPPVEPVPAAPVVPQPAMAEQKEDPPFDGPYKDTKDNKDQFGNTIKHPARHLAKKGMAAAIAKAKKAGATAETIIRIGGQEMTLGEAITKAGMKVEDVFGNKAHELIEFVKSMYNTEEGSFPKGEEGVLIACEKKFGEGVAPMAKKVIGKLQHVSEVQKMKELAGVGEQAKWRNPKYKDQLYRQNPDDDEDDYYSLDPDNRPDNDPGKKRRMGGVGDEWEVTDKLSRGHMDTGNTTGGAHWSGMAHGDRKKGDTTPSDISKWNSSPYKDSEVNTKGPRKGLVSKGGIRNVKDRIKGVSGQHHKPNLPEDLVQMLKIAGLR